MGRRKREFVKRDQLAPELDCNAQSIVRWAAEDLPIAKRGSRGIAHLYDVEECRAWKEVRDERALEDPIDLTYERARKERAQALLDEQKFALLSGQLLRADAAAKEWGRVVAAIRGKATRSLVASDTSGSGDSSTTTGARPRRACRASRSATPSCATATSAVRSGSRSANRRTRSG